jgi:hypothetical protein
MHTTCFDQHWSSSDVSKICDETAVLPPVSSNFGICPRVPMCPVLMGNSPYSVMCSCRLSPQIDDAVSLETL